MNISIEHGNWKALEHECLRVRLMVFVAEQKVPKDEEVDADDPRAEHFVARDPGRMVLATARILPDGRIGRLAVLKPWRGRGIGRQVLEAVLAYAKEMGLPEVSLHAQCHARGFYEQAGFEAEGPEFDECGIRHILMKKRLGAQTEAS